MKRFKRNQLEISSSQGKKKKKKKINLTAVMLQPSSLTFHHLHILQRKLPEELVFTGGVDRTCCWISERQQTKENMLFIYYKEYNNDKYYNNPRGSLEQLQHRTGSWNCVLMSQTSSWVWCRWSDHWRGTENGLSSLPLSSAEHGWWQEDVKSQKAT